MAVAHNEMESVAVARSQRPSWWSKHGRSVTTYAAFVLFVLFIGFPFYFIVVSSITRGTNFSAFPLRICHRRPRWTTISA